MLWLREPICQRANGIDSLMSLATITLWLEYWTRTISVATRIAS